MHLAAAVGTPVVAIFGMTDPKKTGPLGTGHVVLRASEEGARDIGPDAPEAIACLQALGPDRVHDAVVQVLGS
jgi:ADP-heptose:LPS heptosyltransferase